MNTVKVTVVLKRGECVMLFKHTMICFLAIASVLLTKSVLYAANPEESLNMEEQEYRQDLSQISSLTKAKDLMGMEKFADEIQRTWSQRNKEYYADLMLNVCKSLSSGRFKDDRQYSLARKYALLALQEPDAIPLEMEVALVGYVMSDMVIPSAPRGQEWEQQRKMDMEVRFHAWKRLTDAIDPTWDPNDLPLINVPLSLGAGGEAGGNPKHIKDPKLRAEYEAAIEKNRQKAERYSKQHRLRKLEKRFKRTAERYIVRAYSKPPFNLTELKQYLKNYVADQDARARIWDAVTKKMAENN